MTRTIKCPRCGVSVEEVWFVEKTGISQSCAWCPCGWGGSYPVQKKNPFTGKYAWEAEDGK